MSHAVAIALAPTPGELVVEYLAAEPGRVLVVGRACRFEAVRPACGTASRRVHIHYERRLDVTAELGVRAAGSCPA